MKLKTLILTGILFLTILPGIAQEGVIMGTVIDEGLSESLPGVQILVEGTTTGTLSDIDGNFSISLEPGTYSLSFSYVSFQKVTMSDIVVRSGQNTVLDRIGMKESALALEEVIITAQAVRNTENAVFSIRKKSATVIDGISSDSFKKIGDSDAASTMRRVTGVSVEGGKYVYIRGLGDRYTKTIMNGVEIPGLDPDRNTLQMDLFPTTTIDNIIVHKSFSADLPADFTGGIIDINLKEFPESKMANVSFSTGYSPGMHFNSNWLTYAGGGTDFLGFDDGTRAIPAVDNVPFFSEVIGNPNGPKADRYKEILAGFGPTMAATRATSLMDMGLGFSLGNQRSFEKIKTGYYMAFSYKNSSEYFKNAEFGRYGLSANPEDYEMELRELQTGEIGSQSALISLMGGYAIKTSNSKYKLAILHLQNGESRAGMFDYSGNDQGSVFDALQHNLDYSQRSLSNLLLSGTHNFGGNGWELNWKVAPTLAVMKDPDVRFSRYEKRENGWAIGTEVGFPERIWRDLDEINLAGQAHASREFTIADRVSHLRFGGGYTFKQRDFSIHSYAFNIRGVPLTGNPDELFYPENLWPLNGDDITKGTTYEARFIPHNPNQFSSTVHYTAAYVSTDLWLTEAFKAIIGVRAEQYVQRYTGTDQLGIHKLDNDKVLDQVGLFPSLNLVYMVQDNQNLRFSYSKTIARPSFKELSYAEIYDPITGRTFVGGLFRDANDAAGIEYWDGNLISTDIHNFDLRWEQFGDHGQMFAISAFYKKFINPIEIVQFATQTGAFQPRNVGNGDVVGIETEFRLHLGRWMPLLDQVKWITNLTWAESRIQISPTELQSREENARTGQQTAKYRDMAGQAPFIINSGFLYDGGEHGFWHGFQAGLFYNVQGPTLLFAGIVDRPDIYSRPYHSLNLNASKQFGKDDRIRLALKIENLLNDADESVFRSYNASDQIFERLLPGMHFKATLTYALF